MHQAPSFVAFGGNTTLNELSRIKQTLAGGNNITLYAPRRYGKSSLINLHDKLAEANKKWIIAFDEFQEVTKLNGDNFEKLLRSCIQNHQNVSYLFLGSKTHLLQDMFNNKNRAFYNAAAVMGIDKIDKDKSLDYLQTRFKSSEIRLLLGVDK